MRNRQHHRHPEELVDRRQGQSGGKLLIGRAEQTAEQDEQEEEQPGNDIGHHEAAADGAHEAEEVDGRLVRQEADQEEGEVSAQQAQAN